MSASPSVPAALAERFPRLFIAPGEGASRSPRYVDAARRGVRPEDGTLAHFVGSARDRLWTEPTPAGEAEIVFLENRADFECLYRALACRCENAPVPQSMGAASLSGLIDWKRIHDHEALYRARGGDDWAAEFARFTADKSRYTASLILLSSGPYSALPAEKAGFSEEKWRALSLEIRLGHELTHFVCRRLRPGQQHALWDELLADGMGVTRALGRCDAALVRAFLGVTRDGYTGGRLENYVEGPVTDVLARGVWQAAAWLEDAAARAEARGLTGYDKTLFLQDARAECLSLCGLSGEKLP